MYLLYVLYLYSKQTQSSTKQRNSLFWKEDKLKCCCAHISDHSFIIQEIKIFAFQLRHHLPLPPYQRQVSTAGLDLVLDVSHRPSALHQPILGVAEVTGGVDVPVELIQRENTKSRGVQRAAVCWADVGGEDSQQIFTLQAHTLSHLLRHKREKNSRQENTLM